MLKNIFVDLLAVFSLVLFISLMYDKVRAGNYLGSVGCVLFIAVLICSLLAIGLIS